MPNDVADPIAVTEAAARKARSLAQREGRPDAYLRVRVLAGGCSGFTYRLTFEDGPDERDVVVRAPDGFGVLVDPASVPIVAGSTLDFDAALMGGGLRMRNPRAKNECACGDSFSL